MKPHDDIETDVAGAQEGDREAFDRLSARFRPGLTAEVLLTTCGTFEDGTPLS